MRDLERYAYRPTDAEDERLLLGAYASKEIVERWQRNWLVQGYTETIDSRDRRIEFYLVPDLRDERPAIFTSHGVTTVHDYFRKDLAD